MLAGGRGTSKTASRQLAEGEDFLQGIRFKVAPIAAEWNEWYDLANETLENLKTARANKALQSLIQAATLRVMDGQTAKIAKLQEQSTTDGAELSKLCSKNGKLADELNRV